MQYARFSREGGSRGLDGGPNVPSDVLRMTLIDGGRGRVAASVWGGHRVDIAQEESGEAAKPHFRMNPTNAVETVTKTARFYMCGFYGVGGSGHV